MNTTKRIYYIWNTTMQQVLRISVQKTNLDAPVWLNASHSRGYVMVRMIALTLRMNMVVKVTKWQFDAKTNFESYLTYIVVK